MAVGYQLVQWNAHKKIYDSLIVLGIALYLVGYILIGSTLMGPANAVQPPILLMRAFGTCALVMLHIVLLIGPLARINKLFLPLLYNRRHLGVLTFIIALAHAAVATVWYHFFSEINPFVSIFTSNDQYGDLRAFPFESLGVVALLILFLMAATSHDFWLKNISPGLWKTFHMLVYVAYGAVIMHVALGILQAEQGHLEPTIILVGFAAIITLHLIAGLKDKLASRGAISRSDSWQDVGTVASIPENRAVTVNVKSGERIAVFKYDGKVSAVSALCAHQNGPLNEGKVIDGCITCPWHGYQYDPANGTSPPPFEEKIATFHCRVEAGRVQVNTTPLPPGTPVEPAPIN